MSAEDEQEMLYAAAAGNVNKVLHLLEEGTDPDAQDDNGNSAIIFAAQGGHLELVSALLQNEIDPNIKGSRGFTALHHAVELGSFEMVETLLDGLARPDLMDRENMTPLMHAVIKGDQGIMKLLLDYGAQREQIIPELRSLLPVGSLGRTAQDTPMYPIEIGGVTLDPSKSSTNLPQAENDYILIQTRSRLDTEDGQHLQDLGVQLLSHPSKNTYLCRYPARDLEPLRNTDFIAYVGNFPTIYKIDFQLRRCMRDENVRYRTVKVSILCHADSTIPISEVKEKSQCGDEIELGFQWAELTTKYRYLTAIASIDEVASIQKTVEVVNFGGHGTTDTEC
ncbi:ankyrin repeat-containing domain protein [Nemania sp. FL0031]|nr:ankyrin repeat-containing domain protein [Nemania sp. FL0031]